MEKSNTSSGNKSSYQLELFERTSDSKQGFPDFRSSSNIDGNGAVIVNINVYKASQQISKFYEEVNRLTAHLD